MGVCVPAALLAACGGRLNESLAAGRQWVFVQSILVVLMLPKTSTLHQGVAGWPMGEY